MHRQHRTVTLLTTVVVVVLGAFAIGSAAAAAPGARSAATCAPPQYPGSGYFTSLRVTATTCATGKKVTLAHYRCRTRHGRSGRCTNRVLGYRCSEHRNTIPTEFNSRVTCKRGSRRVIYTYQQNT
jgi:hypothetical protein